MISWSANLSMLFTELPYRERPKAAARAGFEIVESWWPPAGELEGWAQEVTALDLRVVCINCECADVERRGGCLNVPGHRSVAAEDLRRTLALSRRLESARVNLPIGYALPGVALADQLDRVAEALHDLSALAADARTFLLVEPMNGADAPGYLVPDPEVAERLVSSVGSPWVRVLFDAYHSAREGRSATADATSFVHLIEHVQYADCPGRGAPGTGVNDLWALVEALDAVGYDGAIGLEYRPGGSTFASLAALKSAPSRLPIRALA